MATFGQFYEMGPFFSGGTLVAGAKIYHYSAGTTTLLNTYTGRDKATPAAQPVVADSQGIASFFGDGIYKLVVADPANVADPPTLVLYTFDNVNLTDGSLSLVGKGENIASASTLILGTDGDEFLVTGAVTINLISGTQTTVKLVFASTLTMTYSGNLLLAGGSSATTAANDGYTFVNEGLSGGNYIWRETSRATSLTTSGFSTGDVKLTLKTAADPTWVLMNDTTIGSGSSGATGRANADTSALYTLLWTNAADQWAPVTGGRGASAAADFAANKPLALPKALGRALAGYGSGLTVVTATASSANGLVVTTNSTKWVTGMFVTVSALSGFGGTIAATTYYLVRVSATNIRFATSITLAQALTPDVTITGSGSATVTYAFTARSLGEHAGEDAHFQSANELVVHAHQAVACDPRTPGAGNGTIGGGNNSSNTDTVTTATSGSNSSMNIMQGTLFLNVMVKL